jgi:energy-coupling factor transporter ATP-binding protein EcfA2
MSIANYREHRQAFKALLEANCSKPILLFKGESGTGKSTLMEYCRSNIHQDIHQVPVDLRNTTNAMQIFLQTVRHLSWDYFDNFRQQVSELNRQFKIDINSNTQAGVGNVINVELKALFENTTPEQRAERYTTLTHAWTEDINKLDKPCILLLDVYDQAKTEIKGWIDGDFLSCAADSKQMRVVIAGQSVPESFSWNHCCELKKLYGVHEAEEWLPVIRAMGRIVPAQNPLDFLAGICHALNGNPAAIVKAIENFPRAQ